MGMRLTIVNALVVLSIVNPAFGQHRDRIHRNVVEPCLDHIEDVFVPSFREEYDAKLSEDELREVLRLMHQSQVEELVDSLEGFYDVVPKSHFEQADELMLAICRDRVSAGRF